MDKDHKGYLTREELESMMKTSGEPLQVRGVCGGCQICGVVCVWLTRGWWLANRSQDQELDAFLKGLEVAECIDASSGNIYYAKYAAVLAESTAEHPGAKNV